MGYIHDGRVNYIREFYLHDRPANRQRLRMGNIHDGLIHLGEGVSIQSFSLTHSFSAERFWIQMEWLYYTSATIFLKF